MQLDSTDFLQNPRLQSLQSQAESSQQEDDKKRFLMALAREIIANLSSVTVDNLSDGININNLDEVHAALHNELAKATKPITDILNKLKLSTDEQTKFLQDVQTKADNEVDDTVQTVVVKRIKDKVEVTNLSDIVMPTEVSVNNLTELASYLEELINKVSELKLSVTLPAPQVNVNPTPVHIPETVLNVPPVNLEPIISELNNSLKKLRTNDKSHPLAVRITDGADWVKQLVKIQQETSKAVQAFAGGSNQVRLLDANMNVINPGALSIASSIGDGSQTVATAGTRVQLITASTPCRYVIIVGLVTNTDTIWVGGTTVAAGRGRPLVAIQSEKIDIDNVNKIWIDAAVNGEGVSFAYVS